MKPRILVILLANLFAVSAACAQEGPFSFGGAVSLGAIGSDIDAKDEAKATEYRDLDSGGILNFDLKGRGGSSWVDLFGENVGRRDQFIELNGGLYGLFKARLFLNDIVHNQALEARTPYSGVGSADLRAPVTGTGSQITLNTNPDTWNTFDSVIKRRNIGGYAEISPGSSFYARVDATESRWSGTRIIDSAFGTSPVFGYPDLPSPVDYVARTVSLEGGYSSKAAHVSASVTRTKFTNDNSLLTWTNPYFGGGIDTTVLPQDNEQTKWALSGVLKKLPLDSTLAARVTYAKTENHVPLLTSYLNTGNSNAITQVPASVSTFDGSIKHRTASLAFNSQLTRDLDSRIYWGQVKKENESTQVAFTTANVFPELFSYDKKNYGIEFGYRLPRMTRLTVGYDYTDTDRERVDFDNTKDKKAYVELKTGAWDVATIRARLQRLERRSNFIEGDAGASVNDPAYINRFMRRFDLSNVDQDLFKLVLDVVPVEHLDLGLEAIFKNNDYKDVALGRNKDRRSEVFASAGYGDRERWRLSGFVDAEWIQYDSLHRAINSVAGGPNPPEGWCAAAVPNCFDPITGPATSTVYNWSGKIKERNYAAGLAADVVLSPRFKLNASYTWQKTDGSVDLAGPLLPAPFVQLQNVPVSAVDDITIHTIGLKGTYKVSPKIDVTGGYAYEKYEFTDNQYANYQYTVAGGAPNQRSYLSGIFANPDYKLNVVYVYLTYRF